MNKLYLNLITTACLSIAFVTGGNGSSQASDIESKNTTYRMEVNHLSGKIHFQGKETAVTPTRPAEFTLKRGTAVEVWIMDNNPFLFTYQDKVVTKETADYANVKQFLSTLEGALKPLGLNAPTVEKKSPPTLTAYTYRENPEKTILNLVKEIKRKVGDINNYLNDRKSIIAQTTRPAEAVDTAKKTLEGWKLSTLDSELRENYAALKKAIEESSKELSPGDKYKLERLTSIIKQLSGETESINNALQPTTDLNAAELKGVLEEYKKDLEKSNGISPDNTPNKIHLGLLVLSQEKDLLNALAALREFERVLNQVHSGVKLNIVETKDSRMRSELIISVTRNTTYRDAGLLSVTAMKAQDSGIGNLQLHFERKSYVRYTISPGVVYSFVEDPEFKVKEDSQGNRTIAKTSDDYKALSGAVMLNIIPEKLFETNFEPFLQLGASADSDNIGLLLGAGFSVFAFPNDNNEIQRTLTLSGGVIWQQVEKLQDGLHVGDSLVKSDDLKTDKEMDTGFYLMLGATF